MALRDFATWLEENDIEKTAPASYEDRRRFLESAIKRRRQEVRTTREPRDEWLDQTASMNLDEIKKMLKDPIRLHHHYIKPLQEIVEATYPHHDLAGYREIQRAVRSEIEDAEDAHHLAVYFYYSDGFAQMIHAKMLKDEANAQEK